MNLRFVLICLLATLLGSSDLRAEIVIWEFTATLNADQGASFQMPVGTQATGSYTFDTATIPSTPPDSSNTTFAVYPDAISIFNINIPGFGSASSTGPGSILIGDPVRTSGSFNFLSDVYRSSTPVDGGIVVPGSLGTRTSANAFIFLQDLDMVGLSSEVLSPTPPDLAPFQDNPTGTPVPDVAQLRINFSFPSGGFNTIAFDLDSLTVSVPEPTALLPLLALSSLFGLRRRR